VYAQPRMNSKNSRTGDARAIYLLTGSEAVSAGRWTIV